MVKKNQINKHQTNKNYVDYIKRELLNALFKQGIIAKIFLGISVSPCLVFLGFKMLSVEPKFTRLKV